MNAVSTAVSCADSWLSLQSLDPRLGASPAPRPDNGQLPVWQSNTSPATGRWLVVAMDRLELMARVDPLQFSRIARQPTKAHRRSAPKV